MPRPKIPVEFFEDRRWREKRQKILERDGWKCQSGGNHAGDLNVHHRNYTTSEPWNELDENLITLCEKHHQLEHDELGSSAMGVANALKGSNWMVYQRRKLEISIRNKVTSPEEFCAFLDRSEMPRGHSLGQSTATKLGHFAYPEVAAADLVEVGPYRQTKRIVQLHGAAAESLLRMIEAARQAGIELVPISGFRTVAYQEKLFAKGIEKRGSEIEAARWVAPAGYSEHHTGLAVDLGEGPEPESDVEPAFGDTAAYRWLAENAAGFGFEMSFPANNPQGVGCEPWHWRFVGTEEAERTFAAARHASPAPRAALRISHSL